MIDLNSFLAAIHIKHLKTLLSPKPDSKWKLLWLHFISKASNSSSSLSIQTQISNLKSHQKRSKLPPLLKSCINALFSMNPTFNLNSNSITFGDKSKDISSLFNKDFYLLHLSSKHRNINDIITPSYFQSRFQSNVNWNKIWLNCWSKNSLHKLSTFHWKLLHHSLKVGEITKHYIETKSDNDCPACPDTLESHVHLFCYCPVAIQTWSWLQSKLLSISNINITINEINIITCFHDTSLQQSQKTLLTILSQSILFSIWKIRNNKKFNNKQYNKIAIINSFKQDLQNYFFDKIVTNFALQL